MSGLVYLLPIVLLIVYKLYQRYKAPYYHFCKECGNYLGDTKWWHYVDQNPPALGGKHSDTLKCPLCERYTPWILDKE